MRDDNKLRQLVLLLAERSHDDPTFGLTKLNKLLFFCDFLAFRRRGRPLTGATYYKLPYGPVPRIVEEELLPKMESAGLCHEVDATYYGKPQRVIVADRRADRSVFSSSDLQLIDEVLDGLRDSNGSQVSNLSHEFIGWQVVDLGEEIPFETVYVSEPRPLYPEEEAALMAAAAAG